MLKNDDIVEQFKKSLSITVKSIGKNNDLDINFIKENPSIDGNSINLTEPNIESLQKNLTYIRAEADAMALEFRLHSKDIHQNFIASNELSNEIFNAVEQSRIEAQGSKIFKGIKSNIVKKHRYDLKKNNIDAQIRGDGVLYGATNKFHKGAFESLIKDLKSKADDLGRDAQAIAKITHWYGTRKQLKWWQKLI